MTTLTTILKTEERALHPYVAAFATHEKTMAPDSPPWLRALRTSGISYFAELGLPTTDNEEWRFTDVSPISQAGFELMLSPAYHALTMDELARFTFGGMKTHRLVFVDGYFVRELSLLYPRAQGTVISNLDSAFHGHGALMEPHLGRIARHETSAFTALNTAFIQDGAFIQIPAHAIVEDPIHLLFIATRSNSVNQPRNLILAGAHSQVRIIEDYVSLAGSPYFTNSVTEIFAEEGASVEHLKLQREDSSAYHVATIEARQKAHSRVTSHSISLGGRLARNDINLRLDGAGCDSILNGLYYASGQQLTDHHTVADHIQPYCNSHEFYHGILDGQAKGVFNGKIYVRLDAQKTNAKQTNKNILLSDDASIHTKPQLEILADDVKCSHGATVGQLDDEAIFYLRSRGIGEKLARQMLIKAFASDVLNRISIEPVREELDRMLSERLER